jgi:hypothetical protein
MAQLAPTFPTIDRSTNGSDYDFRRYSDGRLLGLRSNRWSWWTHWRELADYFLPRRYRWLITPNMMARGSPINQHILDSSGVIAARNLASGLVSGKSSPTRPWFKFKIGRQDNTQTSPVSLWLAECERLMYLVFHESNFYNSIATFYYDLVVFGTAVLLEYEDYENVVNFYNPCAGEYYVDIDGKYRPCIFYREYTLTTSALVNEFGLENCPSSVQELYRAGSRDGAALTREWVIAHSIEPNDDGNASRFGFSERFKYREAYWVWGGSNSPQGGVNVPPTFLRKTGYYEQCAIIGRWDLVSNDPYGRSPAMDALPDQKQLQLETRRKAQAIDKMVNPPLVADVQLKNQPASLLPGGITYVSGYSASGKAGFSSVYDTKFPVSEISEDLNEVRERISKTFFNDVLRTASQYETRSNVTAVEWDMRKSESLVMLGPALERIDNEVLKPIIERTFAVMSRANIFPPPPPEIAGKNMEIEFVSMLQQSQQAAQSAGIERVFAMAGNLAAIDPAAMDNLDVDYGLDKYSFLLNNDPKLTRSPEALKAIRDARDRQQQQAARAEQAEKLAKAGKTLSETEVGGGQNALHQMIGI